MTEGRRWLFRVEVAIVLPQEQPGRRVGLLRCKAVQEGVIGMTAQTAGRDWGLFFAGIALVIAGIIIYFWPGLTLVSIAIIAGILLLVGGVFDLVSYFRLRGTGLTSGWAVVNAICSIILGIMFLVHPMVSATVIPLLAGAFVLVYGIIAIVAAISLRQAGTSWGLMLLNGIVSILCALMFMFMPASFAIFLSVFLIMRGVTMCVFGLSTGKNTTTF